MQEHYSFCTWTLTANAGRVHAESCAGPHLPDPSLPFTPRWTPKHRVAVCGGEQAPPDLPALEVRTFLEEKDGFLVGYNTGEWGGGLYWYARDGRLLQTILEENVVELTQVEAGCDHGEIFVVWG